MARAWLGAFFTLLSLTRVSFATVGGPETVEVVGFDAKDSKLYLTRHHQDESGRSPRLEYLFVRGPSAGKVVKVKSWYGTEADEARFEGRLAELSTRLTPATPCALASFELDARVGRKIEIKSLTADLPAYPGHEIDATIRIAPKRVIKRMKLKVLDGTEGVKLVSVHALPKSGIVAVIRYNGIPYEMGYEIDRAVFIPGASCPH